MNRCSLIALLLLSVSTGALATSNTCLFEKVSVGGQKIGPWIDKGNWLSIENQRLTLQSPTIFMPAWRLPPIADRQAPPAAERSLDELPALDPLDGKQRTIGFLLDSRLAADGIVVLRNGHLVAERYRNGLQLEQPRLLLEAARPLLNLLLAISVSQGKLLAEKSVPHYIPQLATSGGLRKISIQRLLDGEVRHIWPAEELLSWRKAAGWSGSGTGSDVRAWLGQIPHWDKPLSDARDATATPDDDLLAWTLAEGNNQSLAKLFCEQLQLRARLEHEMLWLSDSKGIELANGLGLSLRDFAKLGQLLVEARDSRNRTKIPAWFVETLIAPSGIRRADIKGFQKGSELRYGFVHLGGTPNRVALIGSHGTSLYLDFDKKLVIATFASYPGGSTPAILALLEQFWIAVDRGMKSIPRH